MLKITTTLVLFLSLITQSQAQDYLKDYAELIGTSQCWSVKRDQANNWPDTVDMQWKFKYILGGTAIQDESIKSDSIFTSSVRQYQMDSARWVVTYYTSASTPNSIPHWTGNREGNKITLYRDQTAPNGTPGYSRLTFYDISQDSFNWIGEWVDKGESFTFPFWKISCKKIK